jgi:hypothetical protein
MGGGEGKRRGHGGGWHLPAESAAVVVMLRPSLDTRPPIVYDGKFDFLQVARKPLMLVLRRHQGCLFMLNWRTIEAISVIPVCIPDYRHRQGAMEGEVHFAFWDLDGRARHTHQSCRV